VPRKDETPEQWRERHRTHYRRNRDDIGAKRKERRASDPEYAAAQRAYFRNYYHAKAKRRVYGISPEEFAAMLAAQGGRCAICGADKPSGKGDWHLDHDHAFEKRDRRGHRGVLCAHCNVMLGMAADDPARLLAAAAYLADRNAQLLAASCRTDVHRQ
jgi:hypothetical protein